MSTSLDINDDTGVAILNRVIQPDELTMTPDAAHAPRALKFKKADERRMNRLAGKAQRGTRTARERAAAEQYNLVSHMLASLQAKARHALKKHDLDSYRPAD